MELENAKVVYKAVHLEGPSLAQAVTRDGARRDIQQVLADMAEEGWELVNTLGVGLFNEAYCTLFFRKEIGGDLVSYR